MSDIINFKNLLQVIKLENKKLPLEKDVDLELEYRVYSLYDKVRKRWKFIVAFIVLILVIISAFLYKNQIDIKKTEEASILVSQINDALSKEDIKLAESLIEKFERKYKDTDLWKVVLAYKILINKEKSIEDEKIVQELYNNLKTDLKSGVNEYMAYVVFKKGDLEKAKAILLDIDQKNYNYYSARLLLGFIYKKQLNTKEAENIFKLLSNAKYRYFSLIGKENL